MRTNKVRITESRLRGMIREAVKQVLRENEVTLPGSLQKVKLPDGMKPRIRGQYTISDLIEVLQECDGNERVEVYDGKDGFSTIYAAIGPYLFLSDRDFLNYVQSELNAQEERRNEYGRYGGGEGNAYLSNPSSLPAGWQ